MFNNIVTVISSIAIIIVMFITVTDTINYWGLPTIIMLSFVAGYNYCNTGKVLND